MTYNKEFETENEVKEKDLVETRESCVSVRLDGVEKGAERSQGMGESQGQSWVPGAEGRGGTMSMEDQG